jgi:hypothetical protein
MPRRGEAEGQSDTVAHGPWGPPELALDHGRFVTEARRALHWHGWSDSFEKPARIVSATGTGP